ncbi:putative antiporter subunit mnhG2 [Waddlia chondrophila 2032/99]|nr:monovalent cation/H(+) antiporter subunit G [Waddlia chondrophila]CCB90903.1 putative antiporter subunit mnhG2 [Waddlia chondrophila 2032/99]
MTDWVSGFLLMSGSFFMLVASIGVVKFPDVYARIHAITKATSLGMILLLAAAVVLFPMPLVFLEVVATLLFIVMTAPVGSHMISRIAYKMKVSKKGMPDIGDEVDS